ncbi:thioredoxin-disulfide reductase [Candidatus Woesebacteria bacterium]|nr:thioredoxin-disulfide reductase [Candidatus Woesebacteria bacterium]
MDQQIFAPKPDNLNGPWDTVIIGSGPAGLTAAIYTTRGAASTLILGGEVWGGQLMLTTNVDNYPGLPGILGPELMGKMREHSVAFGAEFLQKNAESIDVSKKPFEVTSSGQNYKAHSVIIATGAETMWLDLPGERELIGRGVSSCAPCDAPFFRDKKVGVIGGGDSAMEEALVLTKYANEVTLIHRRDEFRASAAMQARVKANPKIKILWDTEVTKVNGQTKLESVSLKNNKTNEESELALDGIFVAIGHKPATTVFQGKIELDQKGYVVIKDHTKTSVEGIFVAGDVHDYHYKQAVTAAGFGCMAAMDALKYLDGVKK